MHTFIKLCTLRANMKHFWPQLTKNILNIIYDDKINTSVPWEYNITDFDLLCKLRSWESLGRCQQNLNSLKVKYSQCMKYFQDSGKQ